MNSKKNLIVILLILIVPLALYYLVKPGGFETPMNIAQAFTAKKPVVLDFSSELCYECKELDKVIKPAMVKYQDKVIFKKVPVNSDNPEYKKLIEKYEISVVPTLVLIDKNGKAVEVVEGSMSEAELEGYLNKLING